jgi:molybdenum cofactor cytidylyltransferase
MIAAIIPAAGQSRRMGVQKTLLPFGPTTVIGHIVDQIRQGGIDEIYVVVGYHAGRVVQALSGRPVRFVPNPQYRQTEMLSSIRCGLRALPQDCTAILLALGDQPAITATLIRSMTEAFATGRRGIVVPVYRRRRGHPLLFARHYCQEVLTRYDDVGLRGLVSAHAEDVFELCVPNSEVLSDVDFPEDYRREVARLAARCAGGGAPNGDTPA